jgi:hypothetical protein
VSTANPNSFTEWWANLPIPWLVTGANGQKEAAANGAVLDGEVSLLKQAGKVAMPDFGPADALPHQANDRGLVIGPPSIDTNPRLRLRSYHDTWKRAGLPVTMLEQLYWAGYGGAVIVQQNGLAYSLSAAPTAGVDPTSLLTITTLSATATTIAPAPPATHVIPAGTPWWTFDGNTDLCDRWAILFPGPLPGSAFVWGTAAFTASSTATVTWSNVGYPSQFQDTGYHVIVGPPTVTDGGGPVTVDVDGTSKTTTTANIIASGAFTGTADCIAYRIGDNPFGAFQLTDLGVIRRLITLWKPARTTCVSIYVLVQGRFWDWPIAHWNDSGLTWGPSVTAVYAGA